MSLDVIEALVSTPSKPVATGSELGWQTVEGKLELIFPPDYKRYLSRFGVGRFNGFLTTLSPFSANPFLNILHVLEKFRESERVSLLNYPKGNGFLFPPFKLHPATPGLLPWGSTSNGDDLLWHTMNSPDRWPTIIYNSRDGEYETWNHSMTGVLAGLLSGRLESSLISEALGEEGTHHTFVPSAK